MCVLLLTSVIGVAIGFSSIRLTAVIFSVYLSVVHSTQDTMAEGGEEPDISLGGNGDRDCSDDEDDCFVDAGEDFEPEMAESLPNYMENTAQKTVTRMQEGTRHTFEELRVLKKELEEIENEERELKGMHMVDAIRKRLVDKKKSVQMLKQGSEKTLRNKVERLIVNKYGDQQTPIAHILVLGECGHGKSALINTLVKTLVGDCINVVDVGKGKDQTKTLYLHTRGENFDLTLHSMVGHDDTYKASVHAFRYSSRVLCGYLHLSMNGLYEDVTFLHSKEVPVVEGTRQRDLYPMLV